MFWGVFVLVITPKLMSGACFGGGLHSMCAFYLIWKILRNKNHNNYGVGVGSLILLGEKLPGNKISITISLNVSR